MKRRFLQYNEEHIEDSLSKRGLYAEQLVFERSILTTGIARIKNYLLQKEPDADGIPFLMIPYSEKLKTLYSVLINCKQHYNCEMCYRRNECFRNCLQKMEKRYRIQFGKVMPIQKLILGDVSFKADHQNGALELLQTIIYKLGENLATK